MSNPYLVSVRLMVYNNEDLIRDAIEGILKQKTNFLVEVVIGDDFSTDNSLDIIREYHDTSTIHFKILERKVGDEYWKNRQKLGRLHNFYNIIDNCTGKYIALLDGDDYWTDSYKLQKQVDFLEGNEEFAMCFHDAWVIEDNKKLHQYVNKSKTVFKTEDLFERHFIPTASIVFRNNIQLPDWYSEVQSGDRLLLFFLSLQGNLKYLDEVMSVYRLHDAGISKSHVGVKKVYDTALLLHYFNKSVNYKYTKECHDSLLYEINAHIGTSLISNNSSGYNLDNIPFKILLKILIDRIKNKIK
jgi:glycosyltransferase involved in cell wall biosynthesis